MAVGRPERRLGALRGDIPVSWRSGLVPESVLAGRRATRSMPPSTAKNRAQAPEHPAALPGSGDRSAAPSEGPRTLEEVYRSEAPGLVRYFRARLRQSDEAADLVQESFARLAAFMAKSTLPRPGAYLQRIARNLLYDRSKRLEFRLAAFHLPIGEGTEPSVDADQAHAIEAADVLRTYHQALARLPDRTREVFLLHRVEELSYREIGIKLGISIPTVQYHVARALAQIDAALERG